MEYTNASRLQPCICWHCSTPPHFFTRKQLQKLHRHVIHPSAEKLFNPLKKSRPNETSQNPADIIKNLPRHWDACQRIQSAPTRFRVSLGTENHRFNKEIYKDMMYIDHAPILYVVDTATKFKAARFLTDINTSTVWARFMEFWQVLKPVCEIRFEWTANHALQIISSLCSKVLTSTLLALESKLTQILDLKRDNISRWETRSKKKNFQWPLTSPTWPSWQCVWRQWMTPFD